MDSVEDECRVTARLRLRPLRRADAAFIALYAGDRRVAWMTASIPHPYPPGSAEAFVDSTLRTRAQVWAMDHRGSSEGELVGLITLRETGEIGYWVGAPFWSTGFATEAVDAVVKTGLALGHKRLSARVFQDNPASARVLTKAGFAYLGEGTVFSVARNAVVPGWRYQRDGAR